MQRTLPSDARQWAKSSVSVGPGDLTEQELEVLRLAARGYTNRRVAEVLHLDLAAIESMCADLATRLGARGCVGLIQYAKEHQVL
jgi:DNA-binding NarL/FixJ family response regulator